jgi:hypothetical protein
VRLDPITLISHRAMEHPFQNTNHCIRNVLDVFNKNIEHASDAIKNTLIIRLYEFAVLAIKPAQHPVMPDDHSKSVPPLPIPNRTVKRLRADDSADPCVKVGHRQALIPENPLSAPRRDGVCLLTPSARHEPRRGDVKRACPSGSKQKTSDCCDKTQETVS